MRLAESGNPSSTITAKAPSPSLSAWKEMLDEVGIPKRLAELMTSKRVALTGKRLSGPRPCPGPPSGDNFLNKAVKKDS